MAKRKRRPATEVLPSSIPGAGRGLFAKRRIRKDFRLGEYKGEKISYAEAAKRDHSYFIHVDPGGNSGFVIDGRSLSNPMRWPNHTVDPHRGLPNAEARVEKNRIYYYTTRPVARGEELLTDYGYNPAAK